MSKYCRHCKGNKPDKHFYILKYKYGYYYRCRTYDAKVKAVWRDKNRLKLRKQEREAYKNLSSAERKAKHIQKVYKLSYETYINMLKSQNNRCKICTDKITHKTLHVDHCHKTRRVRGLLCRDCNHGLGKFEDDKQRLKNAIDYLTKV